MKHINIPVFIPHLGCPNDCVFCNQRMISGKTVFDESSVDCDINTALSTISSDKDIEIAYFGGSFTGIDRSLMIRLLEKANTYIDAGKAYAIRISTRPDYIDREILGVLKKYRVRDIELGIQSMSDDVLTASKRGHTEQASINACKMIKEYGFNLVGQMMIGLPCSDIEKETDTAKKLCALRVDAARVYPTVVFKGTKLDEMKNGGEYEPLTLDDAIYRTAEVLEIFDDNSVPVIRVGLCSQDNLFDPETVTAGEYSPAIGEMAQSQVFFKKINNILCQMKSFPECITIECAKGSTSKVIGHKRVNVERIKKLYPIKQVKVVEKKELLSYNIIIS